MPPARPGGHTAGVIRRVRRLLAERSRRGRIASWSLAAVALVGVVVALFLLFPRRDDPDLRVALAVNDPTIVFGRPLVVWPGLRVRVTATRLTRGGQIAIGVRGRPLAMAVAAPDGGLDAVVALPGDLPPGPASLTVRDAGSGRTLEADVEVRATSEPAIVVQPGRLEPGGAAVVAGGGLPPGVDVTVWLDPGPSAVLLREGRTTRDGALQLVVLLPADVQPGIHAIGAERDGEPLAPPVALEVRP